jgi:hypothetical protein
VAVSVVRIVQLLYFGRISDVSYRGVLFYVLLVWYVGTNVSKEYVASIIKMAVIYTPNIGAVGPT